MAKVLALIGSPRKGDSFKAFQIVEDKMKRLSDVEIEYVMLRDLKMSPCTGCHICISVSEAKCPYRAEIAEVLAKMESADGLILVSAVYSEQVTALLKTFIDRLSYLYHRPRFFGKPMMAIVTGGGMFKDVFKYMDTVARAWGYRPAARIGAPHLDALMPGHRAKVEAQLDREVAKFAGALAAKQMPVPTLWNLLWFRIWQNNTLLFKNPPDVAYWREKGWLDATYYYKSGVSPVKTGVIGLVSRLMKSGMRKMYREV